MPTIATRQAAKFWVSLIGLVLTTIAAVSDVPSYITAAAAVCTAVAVYLVPNAETPTAPGVDGPPAV